ncbi:lipopolysaccharide biosynthesis protein [Geomonas sp. Red259]|uniref:Lipopolysaccharide biosynthesis protein n=1 Tax=Geomonas propionica TaxID=2798582 RepID=A0ABS0YW12_9BACT|nr:lipopolysaccharide biosynthesis protein [Geomonas propionica]
MQSPEKNQQEINLLELANVLARRKMIIIKITTVLAIASIAYSLFLPNVYTATARVLVPQKEAGSGISALIGQAGGIASLATGGLSGGGDLYVAIVKSRSVSDAVINRLDLRKVYEKDDMERTRDALFDAVKVQSSKEGIITISTSDKNPRRSAQLANTVVDELGKATVRLNLTKAGAERMFLEKRLEVVKKDLSVAEEAVKNFATQNKVVHLESQAQASITGIARLKADLAGKQVQLSVLRNTRTEESPEVKAAEAGIGQLKAEISRMTGAGGEGDSIPSVGRMPSVGLEYARKLRELKIQEAVYEQLTKQYEIAKFNESKDSSSLQVLDEAVVPTRKSKPLRSQLVIMVTFAGLFGSTILVFLLEFLDRLPEDDKKLMGRIREQLLSLR